MTLQTILKPLHPFRMICVVATYVLGAGLLQYVDPLDSVSVMVQGGVFLVCFVLVLDYLRGMHATHKAGLWPPEMTGKERQQIRLAYGLVAASFATIGTTSILGWLVGGVVWQGLLFLLFSAVLLGALYYLSEDMKALQPYQIFFEALLIVAIPPAMAFFIQSDQSHPFLLMVTLPLLPLYLAYLLLVQLSNYYHDQKLGSQTMVFQVGWEHAMVIHNVLILLGFGLLALIGLLGFPWFLLWPVFLVLPIGLLEIWLMERVRQGGKPFWRIMKFTTAAVFILPIYLLGFAFWTR